MKTVIACFVGLLSLASPAHAGDCQSAWFDTLMASTRSNPTPDVTAPLIKNYRSRCRHGEIITIPIAFDAMVPALCNFSKAIVTGDQGTAKLCSLK